MGKEKNVEGDDGIFHTHSGVYVTTNENISYKPYIDSLKGRKRVLSVTASGDQIINSILYGGTDIIGMDISVFPKYFVALKIAALKTLTKSEYIAYILGDVGTPPLSKKYYEKIRENLDSDSRFFWDEIFKIYSETHIFHSPFFRDFKSPRSFFISNNPYLNGHNFNIVKERLEQVKLLLVDDNIFDIKKSSFGKFDLILLSNVLDYIFDFLEYESDLIKQYRKFFKRLPLEKDGVAVAYNLSLDDFVDSDLNRGNFTVYKVKENVIRAGKDNEIIVYKNKRKNLGLVKRNNN